MDYAPPAPQVTGSQVMLWLARLGLFIFSVPCLLLAGALLAELIFRPERIPTRERKLVLIHSFLILTIGLIAAAPLGKWLIRKARRG